MNLQLTNPLAVFDLETTGLDVACDRIVEIAILRINVDGTTQTYSRRMNPQMPISEESSSLHGIYNKDVENEPTFQELATEIEQFLDQCDLAGYNSNKFDVPLLAEEFLRAKSEFNLADKKKVDVQNIFHKMEQRTLAAAYEFYCNKTLTDAHHALADVTATWEVLQAQLQRYENIENNVEFLAQFTNNNLDLLDFAGRIALNDKKEAVYNFGKHKGKTLRAVHKEEPGYYGWMLNANFPLYTKQILKQEIMKIRAEEAKTTDNRPKKITDNRPKQITDNRPKKITDNRPKQITEHRPKQITEEKDDFQEKLLALKNKFK